MGIYKRSRVWWVDYFDQSRERIQESSHSTNRRDAESLLNIRKSEILRGVFRRPVKISFGEFGERYMEHAKVNKRSWLRDEQMLGHLKGFFGKERQLSEITSADIEGYKMHRRTSVSGSTVNREMALLKRMFNRGIPINADARRVLEYWALGKRNEFVFYNPETGKPFVDLKAGFKLACKKAGISGVTWHTLRHTFASRLVDRGVDIVTVKELLGHSSITVTMRYTHTNLESKRAAVEKLLQNGCDKTVTVCTTMQHPKGRTVTNRVVTLNAARS